MATFHYVYVLVSDGDPTRHCTGLTEDLNGRLWAHNAGQVPHTARNRPWRIETAIMFRSRTKAVAFERYLKSHSGRAFALQETGTTLMSRSQAKRLVNGLERFREVVLDFGGVALVGQGFADEVFRVWARQHPETALIPIAMGAPVAFMVERAIRGASALGVVVER